MWVKFVCSLCHGGDAVFETCGDINERVFEKRKEQNRTYIYNIIYIYHIPVGNLQYKENMLPEKTLISLRISPESSFGDHSQTVPRLLNLKNGGTLWGGKEKICKMWQTGDCWYGYVSWPKSHGKFRKVEDLRSGIQGPTTYTRAPR